jgi:hypothetical protein
MSCKRKFPIITFVLSNLFNCNWNLINKTTKQRERKESNGEFVAKVFCCPIRWILNKIISSFNWFLFPVVIFMATFYSDFHDVDSSTKQKMNKMSSSMLFSTVKILERELDREKSGKLFRFEHPFMLFLRLSPPSREDVRRTE